MQKAGHVCERYVEELIPFQKVLAGTEHYEGEQCNNLESRRIQTSMKH